MPFLPKNFFPIAKIFAMTQFESEVLEQNGFRKLKIFEAYMLVDTLLGN